MTNEIHLVVLDAGSEEPSSAASTDVQASSDHGAGPGLPCRVSCLHVSMYNYVIIIQP